MRHPSGRPWIAAHQGASLRERGNTLPAFVRAVALGADAIELDARRTGDGVVVVHHDAHVGGRALVSMSRAEVAALAPWIPDLADALAACAPAWVDLEIKNDPDEPDHDPEDRVLQAALPLIDERVVVTSFNAVTVDRAHREGLRCGRLLSWGDDPLQVVSAWPGYELVLPSKEMVPPAAAASLVERARQAGAGVGIWTVDDPGQMHAYAAAGVDIVFTNAPDVARAALG